jgi:hypothetical protein
MKKGHLQKSILPNHIKQKVEKGTYADGKCIVEPVSSGYPASCESHRGDMNASGSLNEGGEMKCNINNLVPDTDYWYRTCGRKNDYIYDGGLSASFRTLPTDHACDGMITENGGSEEL